MTATLDVVVGSDHHRLDLLLLADDMLQRRAELDGEPPVGDEDNTDHESSPRAPNAAPHERGTFMTMSNPERKWHPVEL